MSHTHTGWKIWLKLSKNTGGVFQCVLGVVNTKVARTRVVPRWTRCTATRLVKAFT
jgi:hypothetical protein